MTEEDTALQIVIRILSDAVGEENAQTIFDLCLATGLKRRPMETLLEVRIQDIPFPVVSSGAGYFRPASAADVNHCLASLRSRALCIFLRRSKVIRAALAAGYVRNGKLFSDPPPRELPDNLFDYAQQQQQQGKEIA